MAWSDRPWILDGAAVRVSMVGFDDGTQPDKTLDGERVPNINSDLSTQLDFTTAQPLGENHGIAFQGPVKVGAFELQDAVAQAMFKAGNPHGRSNTEIIKPWMNASDLTKRPRHMWIIDFGELSQEEAALFEMPFEYVDMHVRPGREKNNDDQRRTFWWRLGRSGADFKNAKQGKPRVIVTPRVAKYRFFVWADAELCRTADYSHLLEMMIISLASCTPVFMKCGPCTRVLGTELATTRPTIPAVLDTFPFPWVAGTNRYTTRIESIADAARDLVNNVTARGPRGCFPRGVQGTNCHQPLQSQSHMAERCAAEVRRGCAGCLWLAEGNVR